MKKWLLVGGFLIVSSFGVAADQEVLSLAAQEEINALKDKFNLFVAEIHRYFEEASSQKNYDLGMKLKEFTEQLEAAGTSEEKIIEAVGLRSQAHRREEDVFKAQLIENNHHKLKEFLQQHAPVLVAEDPDLRKFSNFLEQKAAAYE